MFSANWKMLHKMLEMDVGDGDHISYTVRPTYVIQCEHLELDGEWYTVTGVELIRDEDSDENVIGVIQLEGQPEDPINFNPKTADVVVEVYKRTTASDIMMDI